ncbi:MAG TPA: hypothetical protein VHP83_02390 [Aggregatilineaceae bacterium]|nr:hypothetical protein [Aggregatilineaceae bacterium]
MRLFVALLTFGACGGFGAGFMNYMGGEPIEADVRNLSVNSQPYVESSMVVPANQAFSLEFDLKNQEVSKPHIQITGMGLDDKLTAGMAITALWIDDVPVKLVEEKRNYPLMDEWKFYKLDREISKNTGVRVRMEIMPRAVGTYDGELMIWVEGGFFGIPIERAARESLQITVQ